MNQKAECGKVCGFLEKCVCDPCEGGFGKLQGTDCSQWDECLAARSLDDLPCGGCEWKEMRQ